MMNRVDISIEQLVDEILVLDCQSGRVKAMEMLVSRWQKRLWQYTFNLTGNADAAWDITQESWFGIIKGIRKLHDPANFRAWTYRITTNKSIDWIRKNRTINTVELNEIQDKQFKEKKDVGLKELMEKLDIKKQVVISLYYFEQLNISEISVALKIPSGTVKSRLAGARRRLKELYEQCFEQTFA
jgi:RNA polymerase sigma-70 factor (ECF subfamily)